MSSIPKAAVEANPDRLLKDALFTNIKHGDAVRLYGGVLRDEETCAWSAVFFAPKNFDRDRVLGYLAALPHMGETVAIKPLEWTSPYEGSGVWETSCGTSQYRIEKESTHFWFAGFAYSSLDEAKRGVANYHEARILAAIEAAPPVDEVKEQMAEDLKTITGMGTNNSNATVRRIIGFAGTALAAYEAEKAGKEEHK